jgi:cystathionine beta-lyase/cystathionine gamma-synthase
MDKFTRLIHPPDVPLPDDNHPVVAPIHRSVKFEFDTVEETVRNWRGARPGFNYLRSSNPTTRQLELTLAQLQGREDALACASGIGAISNALLSLTKQGDHIVSFVELYGPTRHMVRRVLAKFGVTNTLLSVSDLAGIERVLATIPTRLVLFESPTNPIIRIADIAAITRLAQQHGALSVLDNTVAGPHQHGQFNVDVFVHSLTKFASGHGDVMGGAVIANSQLIGLMRPDFNVLGAALDPQAAFLIQRGLKTYVVRYREHSRSAQQVAEFLAQHPAVSAVYYPGLSTHPGHVLARAQMSDFGSLVTFDLRDGAEAGRKFAEGLELFAIAASFGATESLVLPPQLLAARDLDVDQQSLAGVGAGTVRLSIGLETIGDLVADLEQALSKI